MAVIGDVWAANTWDVDAWAANTWAAAVEGEDFTASKTYAINQVIRHHKVNAVTRTHAVAQTLHTHTVN